MGVNEHEGLSIITLRHKLKKTTSAFTAVLNFTVNVQSVSCNCLIGWELDQYGKSDW